jgi:PAB-dependent poly(A)-specific ribonuclease subunit 3
LHRFARDERWSETGDRYIVKLFRDFVFHQMDESGKPVVGLSHVLLHLNKVRVRSKPRAFGLTPLVLPAALVARR